MLEAVFHGHAFVEIRDEEYSFDRALGESNIVQYNQNAPTQHR